MYVNYFVVAGTVISWRLVAEHIDYYYSLFDIPKMTNSIFDKNRDWKVFFGGDIIQRYYVLHLNIDKCRAENFWML